MAKAQTSKRASSGSRTKKAAKSTTSRPRIASGMRAALAAAPTDVGDWDAAELEGELVTSLPWADRQLLGSVIRFLYTVVDPRFLRRAVRAGYTKGEHAEIWGLFDRAAGRERGLDEHAGTELESDPERKRLLAEVDDFENLWFPRVDKIIRRNAPEADAERFVATFFQDLAQQPLGPGVLDSVSTFLNRVDQLTSSKLPGAAKVLATLRTRGITDAKTSEIRDMIAKLRSGTLRKSSADAAAAAKAAQAQTEAVRELRLAWGDWSTTLRPLFDIREQIQLGLTDARNAPKATAQPAPAPLPPPLPPPLGVAPA